jgi:hypothetical protein
MNPADLPSRGCSPEELVTSNWWEGPTWLKFRDQWPISNKPTDEEQVNSERKVTKANMVLKTETRIFPLKYISYNKNVRMVAWWIRFIDYLKDKKNVNHVGKQLSLSELHRAESHVIRYIQEDGSDKNSLKRLPVVKGPDGILRVKTAITNSDDKEEFRYPILMPGKHEMVREMIKECHLNYCHAGTQFLMGKLRTRFWIT